mmetsp:Transcript_83159/g.222249  ORF Transcript_83159/g.222249 Transcript_83159/m.222249 type:complete len:337 (-) Transcript_83159:1139-2149(-)
MSGVGPPRGAWTRPLDVSSQRELTVEEKVEKARNEVARYDREGKLGRDKLRELQAEQKKSRGSRQGGQGGQADQSRHSPAQGDRGSGVPGEDQRHPPRGGRGPAGEPGVGTRAAEGGGVVGGGVCGLRRGRVYVRLLEARVDHREAGGDHPENPELLQRLCGGEQSDVRGADQGSAGAGAAGEGVDRQAGHGGDGESEHLPGSVRRCAAVQGCPGSAAGRRRPGRPAPLPEVRDRRCAGQGGRRGRCGGGEQVPRGAGDGDARAYGHGGRGGGGGEAGADHFRPPGEDRVLDLLRGRPGQASDGAGAPGEGGGGHGGHRGVSEGPEEGHRVHRARR